MAERRFLGRPASPGLALSQIFLLPDVAAEPSRGPTGDPNEEAARLRMAIAKAIEELHNLGHGADEDAKEILEFQIAMLDDEELSAGAFAAIEAGAPALSAWRSAIDGQIAEYRAAEDEYFRARAADFEDLRDRVSDRLAGRRDVAAPSGALLVARDLTPSRFLGIEWGSGSAIALAGGSPTSHVALLARARSIPMVVDLGLDVISLPSGVEALIDGESGALVVSPEEDTKESARMRAKELDSRRAIAEHFRGAPTTFYEGERVAIMINAAGPDELAAIDPAICDGIGLVRTEFLFQEGSFPDEETQYRAYRRILEWAAGRPVTIRTLDAGGDKPIAGLTLDDEANPFLGTRGVRLSLRRPEVFRVQLRALARAATHGHLKIMLPMVATPRDLDMARRHLRSVLEELAAGNSPFAEPPLGIMVEVPAAAIAIDRFDADFFSIGSNDLTQYVMAAARDIASLSEYANAADPAILALIERVAQHGRKIGREVSLCGDAASDPSIVRSLLSTGLRALSVAAPSVGLIKASIAGALDR